jgi:hypothetical protein
LALSVVTDPWLMFSSALAVIKGIPSDLATGALGHYAIRFPVKSPESVIFKGSASVWLGPGGPAAMRKVVPHGRRRQERSEVPTLLILNDFGYPTT